MTVVSDNLAWAQLKIVKEALEVAEVREDATDTLQGVRQILRCLRGRAPSGHSGEIGMFQLAGPGRYAVFADSSDSRRHPRENSRWGTHISTRPLQRSIPRERDGPLPWQYRSRSVAM